MIGKLRIVFWLGVVMMFLPFFGIPNAWKTVIAVLIGISLILIAIQLRKNYRSLRHIIRNLEQSAAEPSLHE